MNDYQTNGFHFDSFLTLDEGIIDASGRFGISYMHEQINVYWLATGQFLCRFSTPEDARLFVTKIQDLDWSRVDFSRPEEGVLGEIRGIAGEIWSKRAFDDEFECPIPEMFGITMTVQ